MLVCHVYCELRCKVDLYQILPLTCCITFSTRSQSLKTNKSTDSWACLPWPILLLSFLTDCNKIQRRWTYFLWNTRGSFCESEHGSVLEKCTGKMYSWMYFLGCVILGVRESQDLYLTFLVKNTARSVMWPEWPTWARTSLRWGKVLDSQSGAGARACRNLPRFLADYD